MPVSEQHRSKLQAPEVIKGEGHDHTADWWSLGILIYEMMVGYGCNFIESRHSKKKPKTTRLATADSTLALVK
jgi:serine/threonine protein kinase